ncbi:MAG: hypothetical protein R2838_10355 [Caldilineaceae bacterium]
MLEFMGRFSCRLLDFELDHGQHRLARTTGTWAHSTRPERNLFLAWDAEMTWIDGGHRSGR